MIKATLLFFITTLLSQAQTTAPLGLPTTITDLYIPGSKIQVIPRKNSESSLVLRILETKPAADGHHYTIEAYALDPGTHQLSDYLQYIDTRAPLKNLSATLQATNIHPLDTLPKPTDPTPSPPAKIGGYKTLLIILATLWTIILLTILLYRKKQPAQPPTQAPKTLQQKLHPLITAASQGNLSDTDLANLERLILGHWKQKLPALNNLPPAQALVQLRTHPEASPLILKLEHWLHSPNPTTTQTDLPPLLTPYQNPNT